ncbi:hypothetical protein Tco_1105903 [Tanacetum coccineum]
MILTIGSTRPTTSLAFTRHHHHPLSPRHPPPATPSSPHHRHHPRVTTISTSTPNHHHKGVFVFGTAGSTWGGCLRDMKATRGAFWLGFKWQQQWGAFGCDCRKSLVLQRVVRCNDNGAIVGMCLLVRLLNSRGVWHRAGSQPTVVSIRDLTQVRGVCMWVSGSAAESCVVFVWCTKVAFGCYGRANSVGLWEEAPSRSLGRGTQYIFGKRHPIGLWEEAPSISLGRGTHMVTMRNNMNCG